MDMKNISLNFDDLKKGYEYSIVTDEQLNILDHTDTLSRFLDGIDDKKITSIVHFDSDNNPFKLEENNQYLSCFKAFINDLGNKVLIEGVIFRNDNNFILVFNFVDNLERNLLTDTEPYERFLFEAFMDNIQASLYFKDKKSRFIKINKSMAASIGINDPYEAIGKSDCDFFNEEHAQKALKDEQYIIQTGNSIENIIEKEVRTDGSTNWITTSKLPLKGENNKIIGTFGISRNITEQKIGEEELKYERFLFNMLMENITDSIYFKDVESKFIRLSNSMLVKHGLKNADAAIGLSDFDLFTDEHASQAYQDEQSIIKTGNPIKNSIEKETWADGSETYVLSTKLPMISDNKIIGTFGISKDVTEIKIQERTQSLLFKLSETVNSADNINQAFDQIYKIISVILPTKHFYIAEYNSRKNLISFPFWIDEYNECPEPRKPGRGLTEFILNTKKSCLLTEENLDDTIQKYDISNVGKKPYNWLGVPLKIQEKVVGVIAIQSYERAKKINNAHQKILTFVSNQIANVLERVRAKEKLNKEIKEREILADSLKKSNDIINNSQAIVFRWQNDDKWSVEFVSQNVEWILGYSADEFLNGHIKYTEIIHKDDLDRVTEELTDCLFNKSINYCTHNSYRIVSKSGKIVWVENRTFILRDSNEEITHYEGILIDVTERILNEEKAKFRSEFEKRIAQISAYFVEQELSNINEALNFASKHVGSFLNADRNYVALAGNDENKFSISFEYTKSQYSTLQSATNSSHFFPDEVSKKLRDGIVHFAPRFPKGKKLNRNKDFPELEIIDEEVVKSFIAIPIFVNKKLEGFLGYDFIEKETNLQVEDLHILELFSEIISNVYKNYINEIERKKLRSRMEKMTQAVEQSANSIVITDIDGDIEYVNPKFEDVTGYTFEEVKGQNPRVLKSGNTSSENYQDLWKTLIKGETWSGEFKNIKKNGDVFWERATISPIKNSDGIITNFIAVKEDITERILVENQLALSQKMESIGQLAAGIAHEINTPMQYVGDNANFLNEAYDAMFKVFYDFNGFLEDGNDYTNMEIRNFYQNKKEEMDLEFIFEEVPQALEQTHTGISRVTQIVRAMKNFAHPGSKEKTFHDINNGIENTMNISRNEWKYVAEVELDLDENLVEVKCLLDELNQVFLNMIVNAAHAINLKMAETNSTDLGLIKIETKKVDDNALIKISDTGSGIDEDKINRIFDPFFTTKEVGKGTGQGLAIAHDIIVNKHSGTIEVESQKGEGTTFFIKIPIDPDREGKR